MPERRTSLRDRFGRRRPGEAVQHGGPAIPPADAAAATALAQEASTPFGYRRPARELLEPFGGLGAAGRSRATAALASVGIAAEPALADAEPFQFVHLRRVEAASHAPRPVAVPPAAAPGPAAAPPASAPATPTPEPAREQPIAAEQPVAVEQPVAADQPAAADAAAAPAPPAPEPPAAVERPAAAPPAPERQPAPPEPSAAEPEPARPAPAKSPAAQRVAARFAPSAPVSRDRRVAAGALGLTALVALIVAVVLLRGLGGDPGSAASALPADEPAAVTAPQTRTAPVRTTPARTAPGTTTAPGTPAAPPAAPKTVTLRVVPTERAYVCIADGGGRTLWEGMLTGPFVARRSKLVLRVGVATAKITANGRPVRVTKAPGAFLLTPRAIRELPGDALVCGG